MSYNTSMNPKKTNSHTVFVDATGLATQPIVFGGYTFPMHSSYSFSSKKVYTEDNSRGIAGQMFFNEKFFVPTFKVKWNYMTIQDFKEIAKRLRTDEEPATYYDMWADKYKSALFYAQEPTYGDIHGVRKKMTKDEELETVTHYGGIPNLEITFVCTMNDRASYTLTYNLNGGVGSIPAQQTGYDAEEFTVAKRGDAFSRPGYYFVGWNTKEDGTGEQYVPGTIRVFDSDETLFAQWVTASATY